MWNQVGGRSLSLSVLRITEEVKIKCDVKNSFNNYYGFTARIFLVSGHPHNEVKMLIILQSYHFQEVPL